MRTLVISDLHLGARLRRGVLERPAALGALLDALEGVHRLVLLGDVIELLEARPRQAMVAAEPVLRALGARLDPGARVVVVPGNHDAALLAPWVRATSALAVETEVPLDVTPALARVADWLGAARVEVRYPGVWLSERVWATHGHYLDRHLLPESAFGVARGMLGRLPRDGASPLDYERAGGPSVTRLEAWLTRWLPSPLAALADDLAEVVRAVTAPNLPRGILSHRMSPLNAWLLEAQMRRAAIPALARVVHRLGVDADWVLFGHVHRGGPIGGDRPERWRGPGGRPWMANAGSWVYEPLLLRHTAPPHPYWPGGAIELEGDADPRAVGLLDHLDPAALH